MDSLDWEILQGNSIDLLRAAESESVQTCITSPPYFGLRDYGVDGQIGLEKSVVEYVEKLTDVFSEVFRVLKNNGTLWLNLGDSYSTHKAGKCENPFSTTGLAGIKTANVARELKEKQEDYRNSHLPEKNLLGIPWRVTFALQDAGWYLRQDIIWSKPNPMPESVTDRCTKSHEYIFLLTKSPKYYYDYESIKEACVWDTTGEESQKRTDRAKDSHKYMPDSFKNGIRPKKKGPQIFGGQKAAATEILEGDPRFRNGSEQWGRVWTPESSLRNRRSVWSVATKPFSEAHFATFPEKLVEPMVLAGSAPGDLVMDIFSGAATTGVVALKNRRRYLGLELNPEYIEISRKRLSNLQVSLF